MIGILKVVAWVCVFPIWLLTGCINETLGNVLNWAEDTR